MAVVPNSQSASQSRPDIVIYSSWIDKHLMLINGNDAWPLVTIASSGRVVRGFFYTTALLLSAVKWFRKGYDTGDMKQGDNAQYFLILTADSNHFDLIQPWKVVEILPSVNNTSLGLWATSSRNSDESKFSVGFHSQIPIRVNNFFPIDVNTQSICSLILDLWKPSKRIFFELASRKKAALFICMNWALSFGTVNQHLRQDSASAAVAITCFSSHQFEQSSYCCSRPT